MEPITGYQLRIGLRRENPQPWRRVVFPSNSSMERVSVNLLLAFRWSVEEPYCFELGETLYGEGAIPHQDLKRPLRLKLSAMVRHSSQWVLTYDPVGGAWEHEVTFERVVPLDRRLEYPLVLGGRFDRSWKHIPGLGGIREQSLTEVNSFYGGYKPVPFDGMFMHLMRKRIPRNFPIVEAS